MPGIQAPWVAGDTVFVVDTAGQLMAITRRDGKMQWTDQAARRQHLVGAGAGRRPLWLASSKGQLVGVDAATGKIAGTPKDLGSPSTSPVVAGGRMFVLTDKAKLIALN